MSASAYGFPWSRFLGSPSALHWAKRDLASLERVLELTPGRSACVQAGGNLGVFPKFLARTFEAVYTFEPASDLMAAMAANAPEPHIIRIQAALGYERKLVGMSRVRRDGKSDNHEGITHVSGVGIIPTLRVDDLQLPVCDLIYLDVEGYEYFALQGATDTIARCRPTIAVEINKHLGEVGCSAPELRAWILSRGYRFVEVLRSDEVYVPQERVL